VSNIIRKILISVCHYFQRSQTVTPSMQNGTVDHMTKRDPTKSAIDEVWHAGAWFCINDSTTHADPDD